MLWGALAQPVTGARPRLSARPSGARRRLGRCGPGSRKGQGQRLGSALFPALKGGPPPGCPVAEGLGHTSSCSGGGSSGLCSREPPPRVLRGVGGCEPLCVRRPSRPPRLLRCVRRQVHLKISHGRDICLKRERCPSESGFVLPYRRQEIAPWSKDVSGQLCVQGRARASSVLFAGPGEE